MRINLLKRFLSLFFLLFLVSASLAGDVSVTHIPLTKFSYPGENITFKAVVSPIETTVSSVTLMYKTSGEYSYTKFIEMKTNNSSTNYRCRITNREETLNDIEYRLQVIFTNLGAIVIKLVPENTDYHIDINPTEQGPVSSDKGGSIILPDDVPDDLKFTGIRISAGALYQNETFGIDSFESSSINAEMIKQNLTAKGNEYFDDNTDPLVLYYFYRYNNGVKEDYAFRKEAFITVRYFDEDNDDLLDQALVDEDELGLFYHDGLHWRMIPGVIDKTNNTFSFSSYSLGWVGLFRKAKDPSGSSAELIEYVSRPSFSPLNGEVCKFGIKEGVADYTIKIIDFKGRVIKELKSNAWDGRDENGRIAESGVYLFQVIAGSKVKSGMICLVK